MRSTRITPSPAPVDDTPVSLDAWGFRDTEFKVLPNGNVTLTGSRYPLAGQELPYLLPWVRKVMQVDLPPGDQRPSEYSAAAPPARKDPALLKALRSILPDDAVSDDDALRLRHGHGHSLEEVYAVRHGSLERVPDLVVFPSTQEQVVAIVAAALKHGACVIPYGGGTNVTDALRCPPTEERCIVSVDLARLDRVLWIDPVNRMACIQAGALGRHIQAELATHGVTMGHEPDSVEFSTLGGWIATHASGMKKNRYGNIEDLVLDVSVVTADGLLTRPVVPPRESAALDPRRWLFGSEGTLGIITQAVVKVFPLPEVQKYGSALFPSFEHGMRFLYDLTKEGRLPASVRLVDNLQFQLGQTLKPAATGTKALVGKAQRFLVTRVKGFDPDRMVACTFLHEGSRGEVAAEEELVSLLAKRHGGMMAGAENGRRGYQLTFGIAYIRDFVMQQWILGESFETSVPWSQAEELAQRVKDRLHAEHASRGLPGKPFVTCRVTQLYQTGVCIYFYFGFYHKGVADPAHVYVELERAARDEILKAGGSISHHHGVGKIRQRFLPRVFSPTTLAWAEGFKRTVDPQNVFAAGNHATVPPVAAEGKANGAKPRPQGVKPQAAKASR
ncbi:MAG TPA: FAD-binding oxidoreductase [Candidatus Thermoplasmatota archaeon]|nr:FAD-binding oxidoreductase [Candidatus Thermoplasmatota archaeon]